MRGISRRAGGKDEHVTRCGCGAWRYRGQPCPICVILAYQGRYINREGNTT